MVMVGGTPATREEILFYKARAEIKKADLVAEREASIRTQLSRISGLPKNDPIISAVFCQLISDANSPKLTAPPDTYTTSGLTQIIDSLVSKAKKRAMSLEKLEELVRCRWSD